MYFDISIHYKERVYYILSDFFLYSIYQNKYVQTKHINRAENTKILVIIYSLFRSHSIPQKKYVNGSFDCSGGSSGGSIGDS